MDHQTDELWQGGPWEQPSPVFPTPPPVHIPPRPDRAKARQKKRRRRRWLGFGLLLMLIVSLTGISVLLSRDVPSWEAPQDPIFHSPSKEENPVSALPQAETGTGVTLTISPLPETPLTYTQVYEKNVDSIVVIRSADRKGSSQGTGIVLTQDGYIITNYHVVQDAVQSYVLFQNGKRYGVSLVGGSPEEDLAVLKIDAQNLIPAEFGDSNLLKVGDPVSALGNPMGYDMTLTPGIISALDRELDVDGTTMYLLQSSAPINYGNSGGALFNDRGQVVGVTTVKIVADDGSAEGLGFAIPTERVKYVVDRIIAGQELKTPVLGITVKPLSNGTGLEVLEVLPESDAQAKGMAKGDIITAVNGQEVRTNRDLQRIKDLCDVGDVLELRIRRSGTELTFQVELGDQAVLYAEPED